MTGANRGLGLSLVHRFAGLDYLVVAGSQSISQAVRAERVHPVRLDVTDSSSREAFVDFCVQEHGRIDVLVNNAGVYLDDPRLDGPSVLDLDVGTLQQTLQVNFTGGFSLAQLAIPAMVARGFGRIINVSSGMGRLDDFDEHAFAYRTSKLMLNAMTISLGGLFAKMDQDLAICSICPGWIKTRMGSRLAPREPDAAAEVIVDVAEAGKKDDVNGKFIRDGWFLDWTTKSMIARHEMRD